MKYVLTRSTAQIEPPTKTGKLNFQLNKYIKLNKFTATDKNDTKTRNVQ